MKIKLKNRSHRCNINRPKPRYSKYKVSQYDATYMYQATHKHYLKHNS